MKFTFVAASPRPELAPVMTTVGFCVAGGPTADPAAAPAAGGASIVAAAAARPTKAPRTGEATAGADAKVCGGVGRTAVSGAARGPEAGLVEGRAADGAAGQRAAGSWHSTFMTLHAWAAQPFQWWLQVLP